MCCYGTCALQAAPGSRTINFNQVLRMFERMVRARVRLLSSPTGAASCGFDAHNAGHEGYLKSSSGHTTFMPSVSASSPSHYPALTRADPL